MAEVINKEFISDCIRTNYFLKILFLGKYLKALLYEKPNAVIQDKLAE